MSSCCGSSDLIISTKNKFNVSVVFTKYCIFTKKIAVWERLQNVKREGREKDKVRREKLAFGKRRTCLSAKLDKSHFLGYLLHNLHYPIISLFIPSLFLCMNVILYISYLSLSIYRKKPFIVLIFNIK